MLNRIDFQNIHNSQQHSLVFNRTAPINPSTPKVGFTGSVHKKLSHFLTTLSSFSNQSSEFGRLLNQNKQNLKSTQIKLTEKVQSLQSSLKSKLKNQQSSMITLMKEEGKERLQKISQNTQLLSENYKLLSNKYRAMKERIQNLENTMGYYNAQETHI